MAQWISWLLNIFMYGCMGACWCVDYYHYYSYYSTFIGWTKKEYSAWFDWISWQMTVIFAATDFYLLNEHIHSHTNILYIWYILYLYFIINIAAYTRVSYEININNNIIIIIITILRQWVANCQQLIYHVLYVYMYVYVYSLYVDDRTKAISMHKWQWWW